MSWADAHVAALGRGETVSFRPHGNSMRGRVESGQKVTVAPRADDPAVDDIVLVRVAGRVYLHLVKAVRGAAGDKRFLIGNNRGGTNGWVTRSAIYGVCTKVED